MATNVGVAEMNMIFGLEPYLGLQVEENQRVEMERSVLEDILQISAMLNLNEDGSLAETGVVTEDRHQGSSEVGKRSCDHLDEMKKQKKMLRRHRTAIRKFRNELNEASCAREENSEVVKRLKVELEEAKEEGKKQVEEVGRLKMELEESRQAEKTRELEVEDVRNAGEKKVAEFAKKLEKTEAQREKRVEEVARLKGELEEAREGEEARKVEVENVRNVTRKEIVDLVKKLEKSEAQRKARVAEVASLKVELKELRQVEGENLRNVGKKEVAELAKKLEESETQIKAGVEEVDRLKKEAVEVGQRLKGLWATVLKFSHEYTKLTVKLGGAPPNLEDRGNIDFNATLVTKLEEKLASLEFSKLEEGVNKLVEAHKKLEVELRELHTSALALEVEGKEAVDDMVEVDRRLGVMWEGILRFSREYRKILWRLGVVHPDLEENNEESENATNLSKLETGIAALETSKLESKVGSVLAAKVNLEKVLASLQTKLLHLKSSEVGSASSTSAKSSEKTKLEAEVATLKTSKEKLEVELAVLNTRTRLLEVKVGSSGQMTCSPPVLSPHYPEEVRRDPTPTNEPDSTPQRHAKDPEKPGHVCLCEVEFASASTLKYHLRYYSPNQKFKCRVCHRKFYFRSYMERHLQGVHGMTLSKRHGCSTCGKSYKTLSKLLGHRSIAHRKPPTSKSGKSRTSKKAGSTSGTFPPPLQKRKMRKSTKNCSTPRGKRVHAPDHSKPDQYACTCGVLLSNQRTLNYHLCYHSSDKQYKCQVCPQKYYFRSYLVRHYRSSHNMDVSKQLVHECGTCGTVFRSRKKLERHQRTAHKPVATEMPPEVAPSSLQNGEVDMDHFMSQLQLQRTTESESPPPVQPPRKVHGHDPSKPEKNRCLCGATYPFAAKLKQHLRYHLTEKRFVCHLCQRRFPLKCYLRKHLLLSHKTRMPSNLDKPAAGPSRPQGSSRVSHKSSEGRQPDHAVDFNRTGGHYCICGHYSQSKVALRRHVWYCTTPRNYVCGLCGRKHVWVSELVRHLRVSHKVTSLKGAGCQRCRITFATIRELSQHSKSVHGLSAISVGVKPTGLKRGPASTTTAQPPLPSMEQAPTQETEDMKVVIKSEFGFNQNPERVHRFDPSKPGFFCKCGVEFETKQELRSHIYDGQ